MTHERWMIFIDHFWRVVAYKQVLGLYNEHTLRGSFFQLTGEAVLRELLMLIAHMVHEAEELEKNHEVGQEAKATLEELKSLYEKGNTGDRQAIDFPDCGIKIYRDKILGHPLNNIKAILGKDRYKIELRWETVEQTFGLIKKFCTEVENHYAGQWNMKTAKDEIIGIGADFLEVVYALEAAKELNKLKLAVAQKGRPRIRFDWQADRFILEDEEEGDSGGAGNP